VRSAEKRPAEEPLRAAPERGTAPKRVAAPPPGASGGAPAFDATPPGARVPRPRLAGARHAFGVKGAHGFRIAGAGLRHYASPRWVDPTPPSFIPMPSNRRSAPEGCARG
jgi:hypothetical protein